MREERTVWNRPYGSGKMTESAISGLKPTKGLQEIPTPPSAVPRGRYIGLLDHDDVLTPDALYEMAHALKEKEKRESIRFFLYSDEDKWDGGRQLLRTAPQA